MPGPRTCAPPPARPSAHDTGSDEMNGWLISFVITAVITACAPLRRQTYRSPESEPLRPSAKTDPRADG